MEHMRCSSVAPFTNLLKFSEWRKIFQIPIRPVFAPNSINISFYISSCPPPMTTQKVPADELVLYDLSISYATAETNGDEDAGTNLNADVTTRWPLSTKPSDAAAGGSRPAFPDPVTLEELYEMMGQVYRSCDFFCQTFEQRYPTRTALRAEIDTYKSWRQQVEQLDDDRRVSSTPSSSSSSSSSSASSSPPSCTSSAETGHRCAAPYYFVAVLYPPGTSTQDLIRELFI